MSMGARFETEGRLRILQTLAEQVDRRLLARHIRRELSDRWIMTRSDEWLRLQIAALSELGAVVTHDVGGSLVVELARRGAEHLERLVVLPGVMQPDPPEA